MKHLKKIDEHFFPESDDLPKLIKQDTALSEGELDMKSAAMNFLGEIHTIPAYTNDTDIDKAYITLSSILKKYMKNQAFLDYLDSLS